MLPVLLLSPFVIWKDQPRLFLYCIRWSYIYLNRHNGFYDSPGIVLDCQQTPYASALWFFFHVLQSDIHLSCVITMQLEPLPNRNAQVIIYLFVRTVFGGLSIYFFNFLIISNFFSLCVPFFISIYKTFRTLCIILIMSFLVSILYQELICYSKHTRMGLQLIFIPDTTLWACYFLHALWALWYRCSGTS